jgi:hypothetical protein
MLCRSNSNHVAHWFKDGIVEKFLALEVGE